MLERRVPSGDVGTLDLGNEESDRSWDLDGVHNWVGFTIDAGSFTSTPDAVNEYTAFGSSTPAYDADGNLTSPNAGGTVVLDYDFLNRLVRIRNTNDGTAIEHVYDAEGRRVRTLFHGGVADAPLERQYVYDGWEVIEEHDLVAGEPPAWKFMRRYVMGIGIDEPICMEVLPGQEGTRTLYYMQSTLGNVVGLTNNVGAVVERYTYDAYGQPEFENTNNLPKSVFGNPYLFTGRRYEPWILPLYEYRNRFYLPEQGRFVQRDPKGGWYDQLNLGAPMAYCASSPVDVVDPTGEQGVRNAPAPTYRPPSRIAVYIDGLYIGHFSPTYIRMMFDCHGSPYYRGPSFTPLGGTGRADYRTRDGFSNPGPSPAKPAPRKPAPSEKEAPKRGGASGKTGSPSDASSLENWDYLAYLRSARSAHGSYTLTFQLANGATMRYHGKGGINRMRESASEKERTHDAKVTKWQWTPAGSEGEALQHEAYRIANDGGVKNPMSFNINNSPGARTAGPLGPYPNPSEMPGAMGATLSAGQGSGAQ